MTSIKIGERITVEDDLGEQIIGRIEVGDDGLVFVADDVDGERQ